MGLQIGESSLASFSEPLALLSDCHRRIERFLGVLHRLAVEDRGNVLPALRRRAMAEALHYFREGAPRHTDDEELSLFPRLRRMHDPAAQVVLKRLDALEADHAVAASSHQTVQELGERWLRDGELPASEALRLERELGFLAELYQRHIAIEDEQVFPAAATLLSSQDLAETGREMAHRRGVEPAAAGAFLARPTAVAPRATR